MKPPMPIKRSQKSLLVADDDPIYRDVAADALERSGHRVVTASDGGEAIKLLQDQTFDAAIIDLSMPVADGLTVIKTSRANSLNATTPIIVITGHDDAEAVGRAYEAGATSFLTKPLNWILFTPHVEFILRSGQTEADLREASAAAAFLSDLKGQFMAALSREFQAPIKTIFGFSELITKEVHGAISPPIYRELANDISKSAHSLNASLLKLMDFGRTLNDQLQINSEAISARSAITDAVSALTPKAERRDITLKAELNVPADLHIQADRALLSQALRGILDNAIRLSPRGGEVMLRASLSPEGTFRVAISDRGPPIPQHLLMDVNGQQGTQKNYLHNVETRDVSLQIAKILAEAHQGRLDAASDAVDGNVVCLDLPRERTARTGAAPSAPAQQPLAKRFAEIGAALAADPRLARKPAASEPRLRLGEADTASATPLLTSETTPR